MFAPGYIQERDQGALGIPDATAAQVAAASRAVDARIGRPAGLLWMPDATGAPGWMATKTPTRVLRTADAIQPGTNVVHLSYGTFGAGDVGSPVVLDRKNNAETCVIAAASGNTITVTTQLSHDAGVTVEFGLAIAEELPVVYDGLFSFNSRPVARLLGVSGNYGGTGSIADRLLAIGRENANPWDDFPLDQCDLDEAQGSCWMIPGAVRGGFGRVRVQYLAGWSYDALPFAIKQATANIVRNALDSELGGNVKMMKAGNAAIERFSASVIDADTMALLAPYRNIRL